MKIIKSLPSSFRELSHVFQFLAIPFSCTTVWMSGTNRNDHLIGSCIRTLFFVCALSDWLVVVKCRLWRLLASHAPAVRGGAWSLCHKKPGHPHGGDNAFVLVPEIPVEQAINDGIQTAIEVGHEIADHKEPLRDTGSHVGRIYGYRQANQVKWRPTNSKQHENHKHGDKIPQVTWSDARTLFRLHFTPHLDDEHLELDCK